METKRLLVSLVHYPVYVLGPGVRVGLWTQGCSIKCKGCMSKHTWAFDESKGIDIESLSRKLISYKCSRLTISGGEPFDQPEALLELLKRVRPYFEDVLVYSGYEMEFLKERFPEHLSFIDALVDGEFIEGLESNFLYKGSDNQRLFVLNENLKEFYIEWAKKEKDKLLQLVEKDNIIYIIGIPYQEDIKKFQHEIQSLYELRV
jgi:anaerobic ribonucleoside-triphosphate reductase activating protein